MIKLAVIDAQLKKAGCPVRMWGRSEVKELCEILLPGETIAQAVNGQYEAGFAMLVATDFRVLLIDKKPKYLTLKDIRFDMITELDFGARLMDATIRVYTPSRELKFTALNSARLRKLFTHTQHKVMEIRNHFTMQQNMQQHLQKNTPPGMALAMQHYEESRNGFGTPPPQQSQQQYAQPYPQQSAVRQNPMHEFQQSSEEQLKLAAAMGAAGLRSIVHNGRVVKDYMTVPFTQRWRKRPYGYTNTPITHQPVPS